MLYLRLFHGRKDLAEEMNDWGTDGPVFGPYDYIHTTYASDVKMGRDNNDVDELSIVECMIYYDGIYYGDWSVSTDAVGPNDAHVSTETYDHTKAKPSKEQNTTTSQEHPPVKIIVYVSGGICQDVKTNLPEDSWEYAVVDYDNEPDLPDGFAPFGEMKTMPSIPAMLRVLDAARDIISNWDSGDLAACVRQLADALKTV